MIGDTWSPIASIRSLKYFLEDYSKHKQIVQQLGLIGSFVQANAKHIILVKLDSRYRE